MKLCYDQDLFIIYLNNHQLNNVDLDDIDKLEDHFKNILNKIKSKYDISIFGFYIIDIYIDNNYGAIIEIKREYDDYYDYDSQVEMTVFIHKTIFLYKINDLTDFINRNCKIYKYKNNFYILINKIDYIELGSILEFASIEYKTDEIIKYGKIIEL